MTEAEFAKLVAIMKAVYTSPGFIPDESAIGVWYALLNDIPFKQAALNLQYFMQTETRQPMPADLRRSPIEEKKQLTEGEAWTLVFKAICNGIYHAQEEYAKLPATVQRAIGSHEQITAWASDSEFNAGVVASLFKRAYRIECEREINEAMISPRLRMECEKRLGIEGGKSNERSYNGI